MLILNYVKLIARSWLCREWKSLPLRYFGVQGSGEADPQMVHRETHTQEWPKSKASGVKCEQMNVGQQQ